MGDRTSCLELAFLPWEPGNQLLCHLHDLGFALQAEIVCILADDAIHDVGIILTALLDYLFQELSGDLPTTHEYRLSLQGHDFSPSRTFYIALYISCHQVLLERSYQSLNSGLPNVDKVAACTDVKDDGAGCLLPALMHVLASVYKVITNTWPPLLGLSLPFDPGDVALNPAVWLLHLKHLSVPPLQLLGHDKTNYGHKP